MGFGSESASIILLLTCWRSLLTRIRRIGGGCKQRSVDRGGRRSLSASDEGWTASLESCLRSTDHARCMLLSRRLTTALTEPMLLLVTFGLRWFTRYTNIS